jgi:DNA-binding MurR/RpiR family transcriptional regulator
MKAKRYFKRSDGESTPLELVLAKRLKTEMDSFTPRQRGLAEFILQNPESLAFLTITDLARKVGISEATVTRFCSILGYGGYAHLCREVQQAIQSELSMVGRFQLVRSMGHQSVDPQSPSVFERVLSNEIENLMNLTRNIRTVEFYRCIDLMATADQICIVGAMASISLANYFGYMLEKIAPRVAVLHGHGGTASAVCNSLTRHSIVFLISFPRYPRVTLELGQLATQRGAQLIAITNSPVSPVVPLATITFLIPVGIVSFVDAYAAPIAFINALVSGLSERNPKATQRSLNIFDKYVVQEGLFVWSNTKKRVRRSESFQGGT